MTFQTTWRNKAQITLTSFLAYFLMSSVISQMGVVTGSMSSQFGISIGTATALFSYLTTGLLIGSIVALITFTPFGLKTNILGACVLLIAALIGIWKVPDLILVPVGFTVIGIGCGILMSAATVVITWCYSEKHRAQMLLVTDSFYSSAGIVTGLFAGYIIGKGAYWGASYLLALSVVSLVLILALLSKYPEGQPADFVDTDTQTGKWPLSLWLIGLALFVYIASFILIYAWVPNYAAAAFSASPEQGGAMVGRLFTGMFFGQLLTFVLVFFLPLRWLAGLLALAALAASTQLWLASGNAQIMTSMLVLGFLTGGILKLLLALGTTTTARPSARMVSFLFFCTAIGSSIAPAFGAYIVGRFDEKAALVAVTSGYGITAVIIVAALLMMRSKRNLPA